MTARAYATLSLLTFVMGAFLFTIQQNIDALIILGAVGVWLLACWAITPNPKGEHHE